MGLFGKKNKNKEKGVPFWRRNKQQAEEETTQLKSAVAVCENDILHSRQMQESLRQQKQETAQQSRSA